MRSIDQINSRNDEAVMRSAVGRARTYLCDEEPGKEPHASHLRNAIGALLSDESIGPMETCLAISEVIG